jgi:arginyl-tRNA synthetase
MGRQIGLLVLECPEPEQLSFDQILDIYVKANQRAEAEPEFAARGYELLVKMEEKDPETVEKFHRITDLCLRGQLAVLERIGTSYDVFDRESDYLRDARLEQVLAALREKGAVFTDEDERVVVDLAKLGHERDEGRYFVLMRANGSSMYGCRDLSYTIHKMSLGADLNLIVLGEDHKLYAEQVALILGAAGFTTPEPIYYAYITLKEGKMSTRKGTVVLLSDFLDEAESRAAEKVEEQCQDLTPGERRSSSRWPSRPCGSRFFASIPTRTSCSNGNPPSRSRAIPAPTCSTPARASRRFCGNSAPVPKPWARRSPSRPPPNGRC